MLRRAAAAAAGRFTVVPGGVRCSARRALRAFGSSSDAAAVAPGIDVDAYASYGALQVTSPAPNVLQVDLHRPKALNAFDEALWADTRGVFEQAHLDPAVRAVVLTGSGGHFTSGLDLRDSGAKLVQLIEAPGPDVARRAFKLEALIRRYQASFTAVEKCSVPVIAAIQGACVGAGCDLVSACDVRYCAEDVFFSIKEVDVGLAADVGTLQRMPRVLGNDSLMRELACVVTKPGVAR